MPSSTHHVTPNPKGGWSVHRHGSQRASRHFATKTAAEAYGRQVSFNQQTVLIIHHKNGSRTSSDHATTDRPKARRRRSPPRR
ncbi:hypothetical protein FIU83_09260 [Halomonas sp. THAF5a]|uniref:DUF2188 domain-containing protein n=1 Tax=Halomonas sp. THAF5a TaxID=2587844 RepID=UPI00126828CF|nr:DUF2188 domain-containing protein [Halomonas sp. THAF5a]QFU01827.1 hypothetical protein FIU83_09260 [Halomonas sp. THAF5a]